MQSTPHKEQTVERFNLNDKERALGKRRPDKTLYLGVVRFRGPRGAKYRPVRTAAVMTPELALEGVADIRSRRYKNNPYPTGHTIYAVDFIGRVLREVEA